MYIPNLIQNVGNIFFILFITNIIYEPTTDFCPF